MTPDFKVIVEGANATDPIRDRLIALNIYDSVDYRSDTMELVLDDRDGKLAIPTAGSTFEVWQGYKEDNKLTYRGKFVYDETEYGLSPCTLIIRAKATNFRDQFKAQKSRSWDAVTLGDIVSTIASDHGYATAIHADLAGEVIEHIDQTAESDLHFLTRLKRDYDAAFKIAGGNLVFMPRAGGKSANTQKTLPRVTIKPGDINGGSVVRNDRSKYGAVEVKYYDRDEAVTKKVKAGDGVPVYEMKGTKATEAEALAAAKSRYKRLSREQGSLNLTLDGRGDLASEAIVILEEFRDGVNGEWVILTAKHGLNNKSYTCQITGELPK